MALPNGFMKASASAFPWGQRGVEVVCVTPIAVMYCLKS